MTQDIPEGTRGHLPERIRILAFCDYFYPGTSGGAERVAREVYTRLASQGVKIGLVTMAPRRSTQDWASWAPGIHVIRLPSLDLTPWLRLQFSVPRGGLRKVAAAVRALNPDLLHANSLQFQTSLLAAITASRFGLPLVITAHAAGFGALPQPWRSLVQLHERTIGSYILRQSARVIAVSTAVAEYLKTINTTFGRASSFVRVIPNGVDLEVFKPDLQPRGRAAGVTVLFVGRLIRNKDPHLVLQALHLLKGTALVPTRLIFAGDGPMRSQLEKEAHRLRLKGEVEFLGFVSDIPQLMRSADILVHPSITEGMSLTLLEAMACGVCVVASDADGNAALIRDGINGLLFPVGDARALAHCLRRVINNTGERSRLAHAAYRTSREYSWDRCARETLGVFTEVLTERGYRDALYSNAL